jgi:hypothetical protein
MHLFDGKKGILRPKNSLVFKLMPQLAALYLGPQFEFDWRSSSWTRNLTSTFVSKAVIVCLLLASISSTETVARPGFRTITLIFQVVAFV